MCGTFTSKLVCWLLLVTNVQQASCTAVDEDSVFGHITVRVVSRMISDSKIQGGIFKNLEVWLTYHYFKMVVLGASWTFFFFKKDPHKNTSLVPDFNLTLAPSEKKMGLNEYGLEIGIILLSKYSSHSSYRVHGSYPWVKWKKDL